MQNIIWVWQFQYYQFDWYVNIGKYLREIRLSPWTHGKTTVIPKVITEHDTLYNPLDNVLLLSKSLQSSEYKMFYNCIEVHFETQKPTNPT